MNEYSGIELTSFQSSAASARDILLGVGEECLNRRDEFMDTVKMGSCVDSDEEDSLICLSAASICIIDVLRRSASNCCSIDFRAALEI